VPLKAWVKSALDQVVQVYLKQPDLEFIWVGDDAVDPLEQAQTLQILVGAGIKTREEARADLGLAPEGGKSAGELGKYNYNAQEPRDRNGRWTTAEGAVEPGGKSRAERAGPAGESSNPSGTPAGNVQVAAMTTNFGYACRVLRLDPDVASEALHAIKEHAGLSGSDVCTLTQKRATYFTTANTSETSEIDLVAAKKSSKAKVSLRMWSDSASLSDVAERINLKPAIVLEKGQPTVLPSGSASKPLEPQLCFVRRFDSGQRAVASIANREALGSRRLQPPRS
jgi:hypothetical protein